MPPSPSEQAYDQVERLVKRFKALPTHERHGYNEAKTRLAFILPLFQSLGWDIANAGEVSREEKQQHDHIVSLVEEMLNAQKEHAVADALKEDRRLPLQDRIDEPDKDIDRAEYQLHGLTEEEVRIVEKDSLPR